MIQDSGPRPSPRCALYVDAMIAAMPARPWMVLARSSRLACRVTRVRFGIETRQHAQAL